MVKAYGLPNLDKAVRCLVNYARETPDKHEAISPTSAASIVDRFKSQVTNHKSQKVFACALGRVT